MFTAESTRPRVYLTTSGTGRTTTLRTRRADSLLTQHLKALPQRARRWDKHAGVWRVSVGWTDCLVASLAREGFEIIDERTNR